MYLMKLDPEQVKEMWKHREKLKQQGIRKPITMQVREAIALYIEKNSPGNNSGFFVKQNIGEL